MACCKRNGEPSRNGLSAGRSFFRLRNQRWRFLVLSVSSLLIVPSPKAGSPLLGSTTILINEVLVNAAGSTEAAKEWVELKNVSGASQTLNDWSIGDKDSCDNFPEVTIPAGGFLILAGDRAQFLQDHPGFQGAVIGLNGAVGNGLRNAGDRVALFNGANCTGTEIDCVQWGDNMGCANFTEVDGGIPSQGTDDKTIARVNDTDTDQDTDWATGQTPTPQGFSPTSVLLISFTARSIKEGIVIRWETVNEYNILGYNVARSIHSNGPFAQMNADLIPARGAGAITGADYSYSDDQVRPGTRYYYLLEAIESDGRRQQFGPISIRFGRVRAANRQR